MIVKKKYLSPVVKVMTAFDPGSQVLASSIVQNKMKVDPLEETFLSVDEDGKESNSDYLLNF